MSRDLLRKRLGAARVAAEPAATDEIIVRCTLLPLALAVAAAQPAAHWFDVDPQDGFHSHVPGPIHPLVTGQNGTSTWVVPEDTGDDGTGTGTFQYQKISQLMHASEMVPSWRRRGPS